VDLAAPAAPLAFAASPLSAWFADPADLARFRARRLGRGVAVLPPRTDAWRDTAPDFEGALALAGAGVPFQIAAGRRYDRSGDPRVLPRALADGRTIFFPQAHQVLPRLARLVVALRAGLLGPRREECSFLFAVEGRGRQGMGLHHDGGVDAFWLQLEGRRTVTLGPPVPPRTPQELPAALASRGSRWRTLDLTPGTLLHMPPRTPHEVVCHERSLAVSLTWTARPRGPRPRPAAGGARRARGGATRARLARLAAWDVVAGRADPIPRPARDRLWVQVPVAAGPVDRRRGDFPLCTADGEVARLPAALHSWAASLAVMPSLRRGDVPPAALAPLVKSGVLAPVDLPCSVRPDRPRALDGWAFA
jgi:hypothetical protein